MDSLPLVILLLSVASAEEVCVAGQQCDASKLINDEGDTALSLLQHEVLLKHKMEVDSRVDEAAFLNLLELGVASGQHSATSILQAVQQMAENDAKGHLHADKITEAVLKQIVEAMEKNVIKAGQTEHNEDQAEVTTAHGAAVACKTTMDDHFSKATSGVNALKTATESAKSTLTTCKTQQATMNTTQATECTSFTTYVTGLQTSKPSCVCSLPTTPGASVLTCIKQAAAWGKSSSATYIEMRDKCDTSDTNLVSKGKECDTDQGSFESAYCSYGLMLTTTCGDYSACHKEKTEKYANATTLVKAAEASRKAEYFAAKKVICYVGVLQAKAADKSKELEKCKAETYTTTQLDISYPAAPDEATCDTTPVDSKPCDSTFTSTHYSAFEPLAPVKACVACAWATTATAGGAGGGEFGEGGGSAMALVSKDGIAFASTTKKQMITQQRSIWVYKNKLIFSEPSKGGWYSDLTCTSYPCPISQFMTYKRGYNPSGDWVDYIYAIITHGNYLYVATGNGGGIYRLDVGCIDTDTCNIDNTVDSWAMSGKKTGNLDGSIGVGGMAIYKDYLWTGGNWDTNDGRSRVYRVSLTDGSYTKIKWIDGAGDQSRIANIGSFMQGKAISIDGDTGYITFRNGASRIFKFDPSCSTDSCEITAFSESWGLGLSCGSWAFGGKLYVSQCSSPPALMDWDLSCTKVDSKGNGNCGPTHRYARTSTGWSAGMVNHPSYNFYWDGSPRTGISGCSQPLVYDGNLYLGSTQGVTWRWALKAE